MVEPLIAFSIVYVGIENLIHRDFRRRWILTFLFGLVHGFGFASALRERGIAAGAGGIVIPLVSFNLGVEAGQLTLAALAIPLLWRLRKKDLFAARLAPVLSVLVALAGAFWLIRRTLLS